MAVSRIEKKSGKANVKKVTLVVKEGKKEKQFDPAKANAIQVLHRIAFTHVDDRMLMNSEDIEKNEVTKKFLGYDNPTTCQLNLNFLYCKAISTLERRLALVEKQLKQLLNPNSATDSESNISGKKRKRSAVEKDKDASFHEGENTEHTSVSGKDVCEKPVEIIDLDGSETKAE